VARQIELTPLEQETRTGLPTGEMARHLNRAPQTLYHWSAEGTYPACLKPVLVRGRLQWPVAGALHLLKGGAA
jgi:hypothetical protein